MRSRRTGRGAGFRQQLGELLRHHGAAEQIALHRVAALVRRTSRCSVVSTPSPTTLSPSACAMAMMAVVIAASSCEVEISRTNERSILSASSGCCLR